MYPLPANVQSALLAGANIGGHIDVLAAGTVIGSVTVNAASVTVDRTATCRRTAKITIVDGTGTWVPKTVSDPLASNGNEVRLWYDIYYDRAGGFYSVPMGTFTIVTTTVQDTGADLTVVIEGSDRSWDFQQRKFVQPYTVAAGQNIDTAIMNMLNSAWSGNGPLAFSLTPTTALTPSPAGVIEQNKDPWTQATLLANSAGFELYADPLGTIVAKPPPTPASQPVVWQFDEMIRSGMKGATRVFTRDGIFSAFEVVGTGSTTTTLANGKTSTKNVPILSYIEDDDPNSPTYAKGKFGVVPSIKRTTLVTTQAQGNAMVATELAQRLGGMDALRLAVVPNPALDVDDVVFVNRSRLGVSGNFVIDSITSDISTEATMTVALRSIS